MKLWIANFYSDDLSRVTEETSFLVCAPNLSECARIAEAHAGPAPSLLSSDFERWVGGAFELAAAVEDGPGGVIFGPFRSLGGFHLGEIYWRRDQGDGFWVNCTKRRVGAAWDDCIYEDPRGWPFADPQKQSTLGRLTGRTTGET